MIGLEVFEELEQGTQEWLETRRGILTASMIGKLISPKTLKMALGETARATVLTLVAERITGEIEPVFASRDMERGTFEEPIIRDIYAAHFAPVKQIGFMKRSFRGDYGTYAVGYSPDGLVGDDGLIEIKSRRPKKHLQTILEDRPPLENMAQLQTGLLVSGRAWIDYVSFCGGMPLYVKRVYPLEQWFRAIHEVADYFEHVASGYQNAFTRFAARSIPTEKTAFDEEIEVF